MKSSERPAASGDAEARHPPEQEAILVATLDGHILDATPAACRMFGRPLEELRRLGRAAIIDESDPRFQQARQRRQQAGIFMGEMNGRRSDGSLFPIHFSSSTFIDSDGNARLRTIIHDMSAHQERQANLNKTHLRLQALSENLPDAVYIMDLQANRPVFFNHQSFLGYTREQLMTPGSILSRLHPQDEARVRAHWERAIQGEADTELEFRVLNSQDEWEWVASRQVLLTHNGDGPAHELMVILSRITERVKAYQSIAYQAALLNSVNDVIMCTDEDFHILYWNPVAERLFEWKAEEVLGKQTPEVLHTRMSPAERKASERQLRKTGSWKGEVVQFTRNGERLVFEANIMKVQDAEGRVMYVAANREISLRKQAEKAAKAANKKLRKALRREQVLARTDYLTGVHNRRQFFEVGEQILMVARRYDKPLSLLIADIDHFKRVNDSFGHQVGDEMLRSIARLMKEDLRHADFLARHGGEEFILLLPETDAPAAVALAERVRKRVEDFSLRVEGGGEVAVTLSIGVAELLPQVESLDRLVARADTAMYQAKQSGRNRTALFTEGEAGEKSNESEWSE